MRLDRHILPHALTRLLLLSLLLGPVQNALSAPDCAHGAQVPVQMLDDTHAAHMGTAMHDTHQGETSAAHECCDSETCDCTQAFCQNSLWTVHKTATVHGLNALHAPQQRPPTFRLLQPIEEVDHPPISF